MTTPHWFSTVLAPPSCNKLGMDYIARTFCDTFYENVLVCCSIKICSLSQIFRNCRLVCDENHTRIQSVLRYVHQKTAPMMFTRSRFELPWCGSINCLALNRGVSMQWNRRMLVDWSTINLKKSMSWYFSNHFPSTITMSSVSLDSIG